MHIKEYFYREFPSQLGRVASDKKTVGFEEKYVFIGGYEWNDFEKDMQKVSVGYRHTFLLSLFMIILTDQAVYTYEENLRQIWRKKTMFPNFGHWGFGPHNENPLWILAKADTNAELSARVNALMPEFAKFLVEETQEYFAKIFGDKIDMKGYFAAILNDSGYKITSQRPENEELRNSKTIATFKQCFETELKNNNLF